MPTNRPAFCAERWVIPDTVSVDALIETVLYEQAWWIAVRSGQHAHQGVVWAEGAGRPNRRPRQCRNSSQSSVIGDQFLTESDN